MHNLKDITCDRSLHRELESAWTLCSLSTVSTSQEKSGSSYSILCFFYRKITSFSNFPLWPHAHNNVRKAWESVSGLQKDLLSYRRCWGACHPDLCCLRHRVYISVGSLCPLYRRAQYQHLQDRGQCTFHVIVRHFQTLCSKCWAEFSIASKHRWWHTYMTQIVMEIC